MKKRQRKNEIRDFINRCNDPIFQEDVNQFRINCHYDSNKFQRNNPERHQASVKRYYDTELGKYACSKRSATRRKFFDSACENLSWKEKKLIGRFYKNCPEGYEVDHIIPVSKGGLHRLSNLQYLTKEENRRKSAKLNWERE